MDKASENGMHAIYVGKNDTDYLDHAFEILNKERLNKEAQTQKATNQLSECTVSQDSLDQSISIDSGLELSGEETTFDSDAIL